MTDEANAPSGDETAAEPISNVENAPDGGDNDLDSLLATAIRDSMEPPADGAGAVDTTPEGAAEPTLDDGAPERAPPQSWTEPERETWDALPTATQDAILRREQEYNAGLKSDAELQKVLAPVAERLDGSGVHLDQYVQRLITAEQFIRERPADAVAHLVNQYGLADRMREMLSGNAPSEQPAAPAAQDSGEIEQLRQEMAYRDQVNAARVEWASFVAEHPDAEGLKDLIAVKLGQGSGTYADAYQAAKEMITAEQGRAAAAAERETVAQQTKAAEKAQKLSLPQGSARGAVSTASSGDLDEDLKAAMRQAGVR